MIDIKKIIINKLRRLFICSVFLVVSFLINTTSTAATINNSKWDLHFENIEIDSGSKNASQTPTINSTNTEITYSVNLDLPGEFYDFTVDVVNKGNMDAKVSEVNNNQLTEEQKKYLSYKVTYQDGREIKKNDLLKAGKTEKLHIRLEFRTDITANELPKENSTIQLSLTASYEPVDKNEPENDNDNIVPTDGRDDKEIVTDNSKEKEEKSFLNFKNPKTGDLIIIYVIIFILALITLLITKKESYKENKK